MHACACACVCVCVQRERERETETETERKKDGKITEDLGFPVYYFCACDVGG